MRLETGLSTCDMHQTLCFKRTLKEIAQEKPRFVVSKPFLKGIAQRFSPIYGLKPISEEDRSCKIGGSIGG